MKVFVVEVEEEKDIDMMQVVTDALDAQQIKAIVYDYDSYIRIGGVRWEKFIGIRVSRKGYSCQDVWDV